MDISILMLGTGSAFSKLYYNNNALIRCGDFRLLVDCGCTGPRSLDELNIHPTELDGLFVTHIHADHVGGLEEIALRSKYEFRHKPTLYIPEDLIAPLWEHTLKGALEDVSEGMTGLGDYFIVKPVREGVPLEFKPGFCMETVRTRHIPGKPSYGLLFNQFLFYSSDTTFDRPLLERMCYERNVRYILHDCQLFAPGAVHAALDDLLTLPPDIRKRMLLMHYGDDKDRFVGKTGGMPFLDQHKWYTFQP